MPRGKGEKLLRKHKINPTIWYMHFPNKQPGKARCRDCLEFKDEVCKGGKDPIKCMRDRTIVEEELLPVVEPAEEPVYVRSDFLDSFPPPKNALEMLQLMQSLATCPKCGKLGEAGREGKVDEAGHLSISSWFFTCKHCGFTVRADTGPELLSKLKSNQK